MKSLLCLGSILLVLQLGPVRIYAQSDQANILFILADDQCYKTLGVMGNDEVHTPNLDRLAGEGVAFTHAFNMGSWVGAVCVASRTMLNTGRYLWNAWEIREELPELQADGKTWGQLMQGAGYDTYMTGKWHVNGLDAADIFMHTVNIRPGMPNQTPEGYGRPVQGEPEKWSPYDSSKEGYWKGGKHWSEVLGDDAIEFIDQAGKKKDPFFMYLAFNAPHDPRQSPKEYVDMYPWENIKVPESFMPLYPWCEAMTCGPDQRDASLAPFPRTEYAVKVNRQEYYAIITHMDRQIGRILDALEKSGKAENTYIIFTADNGLAVGHHGLMGKRNMFDHSVRVPLIFKGPGIPAGETRDEMIYLQDAMATSLEIAGLQKPSWVNFASFLPAALDGGLPAGRDYVYGGFMKHMRMIRTEKYKLILLPEIRKTLLFDLEKDPEEMHDLFASGEYNKLASQLYRKILQCEESEGDTLDINAVYFPKLPPPVSLEGVPADFVNVRYGDHERNVFDFWLADTDHPAPLAIFIHGGGFVGGDKSVVYAKTDIDSFLQAGISFASINYRYRTGEPMGVRASLNDSKRALQYIRSRAAEWNIDKERIACYGGSAGAGTSLWLAFHDDMADPDARDPVLRESTRLLAAGAAGAQATYDLTRWIGMLDMDPGMLDSTEVYQFFGLSSADDIYTPEGRAIREGLDMLGLMDSQDPPFWVYNAMKGGLPAVDRGHLYHHPLQAKALKDRADEVGLESVVYAPKIGIMPEEGRRESQVEFFIRILKMEAR